MKKNLNWFLRKWTLGFFVRKLYPTTIIGQENLPDTPFILIVTPHKTAKETFIVPGFLYKWEFAIMVKSNAFKWYAKRVMMAAGLIPVERQTGRGMLSFPAAVAALDEGRNMLIFPEGTRHRGDRFIHRAKPGFIYIALAAGVPIVLAGLINMESPGRNAQRIVVIDKPVDVKHELGLLGYAAIGTRIESVVARRLADKLMKRAAELSQSEYIGDKEYEGDAP